MMKKLRRIASALLMIGGQILSAVLMVYYPRSEKIPKILFGFNDPCCSLNLVVKHSIQTLPKTMINLRIKIHNHFISPERRVALLRIQVEHNLPRLYPKK